MGLVKRLAKLMVVGDQGIVLLQKLGDLGLRRPYEMINGLAVISCAPRESGRYRNGGHLLGACSRRLLTHQSAVTPSHLRVTAPEAEGQRSVSDDQPAGLRSELSYFDLALRRTDRTGPRAPWHPRRSPVRRRRSSWLATVLGRTGTASGRTVLAQTGRWEHVGTHHGAIATSPSRSLGSSRSGKALAVCSASADKLASWLNTACLRWCSNSVSRRSCCFRHANSCWVRSLMAAACFFAVAIRASASCAAAPLVCSASARASARIVRLPRGLLPGAPPTRCDTWLPRRAVQRSSAAHRHAPA